MNENGCGIKLSWPHLRSCPWIRLMRLRKFGETWGFYVHAEIRNSRIPNTSRKRYLGGSFTRNSARTTASLLMTLDMTDALNVSLGIVILLGLIHIKYRLEVVGTAGPRCLGAPCADWMALWLTAICNGSSHRPLTHTAGDKASVALRKGHSEVRCEIQLSCTVRIPDGTPAIHTKVFCRFWPTPGKFQDGTSNQVTAAFFHMLCKLLSTTIQLFDAMYIAAGFVVK